MLELSELWFILIAVLFIGFVLLEGFDFGVGMQLKFLAKNDLERRMLINTIGPVWDANEVWLLTAGGAMFAAFPHWYATLFSGYYLAFFLMLLALIARGVAFEYRSKVESKAWRTTWDWCIILGSLIPPFLLGALFSGLAKGLPIDETMTMNASFFGDIVNVYTVTGGVAFVMLAYMHGLNFTQLKVEGELRDRANKQALKWFIPTAAVVVLYVVLTFIYTGVFGPEKGKFTIPIYAVAILLYLGMYVLLKKRREGLSFVFTSLILLLVVASYFVALFPYVLVSSTNLDWSITLYDAASGAYTLKLMTIVAVSLVPVVLAYTVWSYYVFRKRLTEKEHLEY